MFNHPKLEQHIKNIERIHKQNGEFKYSMLLTGESGAGKTYLAKHYLASSPQRHTIEKNITPILYCKLTQTKTATDLLLQLTSALGATTEKPTTKNYIAQERLIHLLKEHHVELIIIDEVQECLPDIDGITAQRMAKQFAGLIDNAQIPMILIGTPLSARLLNLKYGSRKHQVYGEEQLSRRFIAEQQLKPIPPRCQAWLNCINYFCNKHVFEQFTLNDKSTINRIYVATHGRPGLVEKLFSFLPATKTEITIEHLFHSFSLSINISINNPFDTHLFTDDDISSMLGSWRRH